MYLVRSEDLSCFRFSFYSFLDEWALEISQDSRVSGVLVVGDKESVFLSLLTQD